MDDVRLCVITGVTSEEYANVTIYVDRAQNHWVAPLDHDINRMRSLCQRDPMGLGKLPVFRVGEILVVNVHGREVAGQRRNPSAWCVSCEEFPLEQIDAAIRIAMDATKQYDTTPMATETTQITLWDKERQEVEDAIGYR